MREGWRKDQMAWKADSVAMEEPWVYLRGRGSTEVETDRIQGIVLEMR